MMEPIKDFDQYTAAKGLNRKPKAGQYLLSIHNADITSYKTKYHMLKLEMDIASGDDKYYYSELSKAFKKDMYLKHSQIVDMEKSIPFFKAFTEVIEASNLGYRWNWQESTLIGKKVGAILRLEEYRDKFSGEIKTSLKVAQFIPAAKVDATEPALPTKRLKADNGYNFNSFSNESTSYNSLNNYDDDDLPF